MFNETASSVDPIKESPAIDALVDRRRHSTAGGKGFLLGLPDSGKELFVSQQIISILRGGKDKVIVIDTDGKYVSLTEQVNGQVIRLSPGSDAHINLFDLFSGRTHGLGDDLFYKMETLCGVFETIISPRHGLSPSQKSILSRSIYEAYDPYLKFKDAITQDYDPGLLPTLRDLYRVLRSQNYVDAKEMADCLEMYVSGSIDNFASLTNFHHTSNFVVYDLRGCGVIYEPTFALAVLDHVWNTSVLPAMRPGWDHEYTWIFIDDIYPILQNEASVGAVNTIFRRCRPFACIPTGVSHYPDIFLEPQTLLHSIFVNSDYIHLCNLTPFEREGFTKDLCIPEHIAEHINGAPPCQSIVAEWNSYTAFTTDLSEHKRYIFDRETGSYI